MSDFTFSTMQLRELRNLFGKHVDDRDAFVRELEQLVGVSLLELTPPVEWARSNRRTQADYRRAAALVQRLRGFQPAVDVMTLLDPRQPAPVELWPELARLQALFERWSAEHARTRGPLPNISARIFDARLQALWIRRSKLKASLRENTRLRALRDWIADQLPQLQLVVADLKPRRKRRK